MARAGTFAPGDEAIRRREARGQGSPVVGTVVRVLADGRVRVRWSAALMPFRGGRADNHSTLKPAALLPATAENVERSQRRIYRRLLNGHRAHVRRIERSAARAEAGGRAEKAAGDRAVAEEYRAKARELERRLEAG